MISYVKYKHIAIALFKNKPICKPKTNYVMSLRNSIHAEIDVIYQLYATYNNFISRKSINKINKLKINKIKRFKNIDILVLRISNDGKLRNSKPCKECIDILRQSGCNKIYYSTDDNTINVEKIKRISNNHICCYTKNIKNKQLFK